MSSALMVTPTPHFFLKEVSSRCGCINDYIAPTEIHTYFIRIVHSVFKRRSELHILRNTSIDYMLHNERNVMHKLCLDAHYQLVEQCADWCII